MKPKWLTKRKFFLFAALLGWFGHDGARAQTVTISPDCQFFARYTVVANVITNVNGTPTAASRFPSTGFNNENCGAVSWTIVYYVTGVTVLSLELDSAPDSSGVPGAWAAFSGTLLNGVNPNTSNTNAFTAIVGYVKWVSVNLTGLTGTGNVNAFIYGCKSSTCSALVTAAISGGSNVTIVAPLGVKAIAASVAVNSQGQAAVGAASVGNPDQIAGQDGSGNVRIPLVDSQGNAYSFLACNASADVALSGTNFTEIVQGTAAQVIRICKIWITSVSGNAPVVNTITVASATITTCAGPTELFLGGGITGMDTDWGGALRSAAGASICVKESVANSDKVTISYQKAAF